jgi:hypothetical protein
MFGFESSLRRERTPLGDISFSPVSFEASFRYSAKRLVGHVAVARNIASTRL